MNGDRGLHLERFGDMHGVAGRDSGALPPIDVFGAGYTVPREERRVAESSHDPRMKRCHETTQRRQIHVVVVIVTQQHEVDRREILEPNARWPMPLRAVPG